MNLAWGAGPPMDRQEAIRLIRAAYDRGVTFFDSAEARGPVTSEEIIGEALAQVRDRVVIVAKFGFDIAPSGKIQAIAGQSRSGKSPKPPSNTCGPSHMEQNVDALKVELTVRDIKEIEDGFAKIQVQGARSSGAVLAGSYVGPSWGPSSKGGHGMSPLPRKPGQ